MSSRYVSVLVGVVGSLLSACGPSSSQGVTAPTVVVAPNASPAPSVSPSATGAAGPIQIATVQVFPQDALVVLQNTGGPNQPTTIDVQGYRLQVGSVTVTLPSAKVAPGQNLGIHAGPAPNVTPSPGTAVSPVPANQPNAELYLGPDGAALRDALKPGAVVQVLDPKGIILSQFTIAGG